MQACKCEHANATLFWQRASMARRLLVCAGVLLGSTVGAPVDPRLLVDMAPAKMAMPMVPSNGTATVSAKAVERSKYETWGPGTGWKKIGDACSYDYECTYPSMCCEQRPKEMWARWYPVHSGMGVYIQSGPLTCQRTWRCRC